MGRRKKEKSLLEDLVSILYPILMLGSIKVYLSTKNLTSTIAVFIIGTIIIFGVIYGFKRMRKRRLLDSGMDIIDDMSGETFEEFLLAHFKSLGYSGQLTPATADYGADLVLEKDGRKLVIQAKRWKRTVGIEAVQQVIGAIKHYSAQKGMVITNSSFTENAYELANSNGIELWDRTKLIELMSKSGGRVVAEKAKSQPQVHQNVTNEVAATSEETCPKCGGKLVLRNGKSGKFIGCSGYPKCRFTRNL